MLKFHFLIVGMTFKCCNYGRYIFKVFRFILLDYLCCCWRIYNVAYIIFMNKSRPMIKRMIFSVHLTDSDAVAWRCSFKNVFLEISQKFIRKHLKWDHSTRVLTIYISCRTSASSCFWGLFLFFKKIMVKDMIRRRQIRISSYS